jgi:hypothetical protein
MSAVPTTMQWIRCAACRVYDGSKLLAWRLTGRAAKAGMRKARAWQQGIATWLGQGSSGINTLLRYALVGGGALLLCRKGPHLAAWLLEHAYAVFRWAPGPIVAVWVLAAYRAGAPKRKAAPSSDDEAAESDQQEPAGRAPIVPLEEFLALLHRELKDARAVHLWYVAELLAKEHPGQVWDVPAVAALCAAAGVPVVPKIRAHGKGATRGVERVALPPLPVPLSKGPAVDVDVAGQQSSTGASTSTSTDPSTAPGEGQQRRFSLVDDPENPVRTHVIWPGQQSA